MRLGSVWLGVALGLVLAVARPGTGHGQFGISAKGQRTTPRCTVDTIKASFTRSGATYTSEGRCLFYYTKIHADGMLDDPVGIRFKAEGGVGYENGVPTRDARESVSIVSSDSRHLPLAQRPAGTFKTRWICFRFDPWRDASGPACQETQISLTGNLLLKEVRNLHDEGFTGQPRPITAFLSPAQRAALNEQFQAFMVREQGIRTAPGATGRAPRPGTDRPTLQTKSRSEAGSALGPEATQSTTVARVGPQILEPGAGSRHPNLTPIKIRVAPPRGLKVETYLLELERKGAGGAWEAVTTIPAVSARQAEGPLGYAGWGAPQPGKPAYVLSTPGAWRIRAQAVSPTRSDPGVWVEYVVTGGAPGPAIAPDAQMARPKALGK